ncbi:MAG TPA: hypothetical protein VGF08_10195 [Terriglobales bacterium]|jgi:putative transposase
MRPALCGIPRAGDARHVWRRTLEQEDDAGPWGGRPEPSATKPGYVPVRHRFFVIKQRFAQRILRRRKRAALQPSLFEGQAQHVWQARFYDFNVWTERKRIEKLRYMHRNPVKRGLVLEPEQWAWSSFRWYWRGEMGTVRLNDETVMKLQVRTPAA